MRARKKGSQSFSFFVRVPGDFRLTLAVELRGRSRVSSYRLLAGPSVSRRNSSLAPQ